MNQLDSSEIAYRKERKEIRLAGSLSPFAGCVIDALLKFFSPMLSIYNIVSFLILHKEDYSNQLTLSHQNEGISQPRIHT